MAQRVSVFNTCDFPHEKETEATDTVTFTDYQGITFGADACDEHGKWAREQIDRVSEHARKVPAHRASPIRQAAPRGRTAQSREESSRIREWARGEGLSVSDRGRIPAGIVAQYKTSQR